MDDQLASYRSVENASQSWPATTHDPGAITLAILENVLEEIDYGVIVIRSSGTILLTNHLAQAELEASSCIRIRNDKLSAYSAKSLITIEHALLDAKNGVRRLVQILSSSANLTLSFAPLMEIHDSPQSLEKISEPLVLVLIGKHTACNPATLAEFGQIHGLTRAENRLLPAICQGASIKEMAKQHRVSVCTVRVHLRSIRSKTGSASLRPLMLQMTTLPPLRTMAFS